MISHIASRLFLSLDFYTEYPAGVGYTVNIFLCPKIYLSETSKSTLVARRRYTVFDSRSLKMFTNTADLLQ